MSISQLVVDSFERLKMCGGLPINASITSVNGRVCNYAMRVKSGRGVILLVSLIYFPGYSHCTKFIENRIQE